MEVSQLVLLYIHPPGEGDSEVRRLSARTWSILPAVPVPSSGPYHCQGNCTIQGERSDVQTEKSGKVICTIIQYTYGIHIVYIQYTYSMHTVQCQEIQFCLWFIKR